MRVFSIDNGGKKGEQRASGLTPSWPLAFLYYHYSATRLPICSKAGFSQAGSWSKDFQRLSVVAVATGNKEKEDLVAWVIAYGLKTWLDVGDTPIDLFVARPEQSLQH